MPPPSTIPLYAPRAKIHRREVTGRYTRLRWLCIWMTQIVYYGLPWLTWNDRPAVLFDLAARKFYLFGIVLWPQDFIYLTGLLALGAGLLFLLSAIAGRVWCSFGCPHTVYAEIFAWIEHRIEGNRSARIRLDRQALSPLKFAKKAAKHTVWIVVALWTGFTLVAYFTPARTLLQETAALSLGPWQTFWLLFYAGLAYLNAGWMREQFCKYLCAWARFQSVMFDRDTLVISYDARRGEPRGVRRTWRAGAGQKLGDCIDCTLCAQVCPTGIDIRDGFQFECIDCAACIDACDSVMDKIGLPRGLIRYTTENALRDGCDNGRIRRRMFRPRVLAYACLLSAGLAVYGYSLATRIPLRLDVVLDRDVMGREIDAETTENVYRVRIANGDERAHRYRISVTGIKDAQLDTGEVVVGAATARVVPVTLRAPAGSAIRHIRLDAVAVDDDRLHASERAVFVMPRSAVRQGH